MFYNTQKKQYDSLPHSVIISTFANIKSRTSIIRYNSMKKVILLYIFTLFPLLCLAALSGAPELYFSKVKGENNISQSNVKCIVQDSYGFMWFGTKNGLNRYDGHRFREFDVDDPVMGCGNHNISALYEDSRKTLWVGTDKGIYLFDPVRERFSFVATPSQDGVVMNDWVSVIEGDKQGNIWIVIPNQGVFRYEEASGRLRHYIFPEIKNADESATESLCVRENGEVWMGSNRGGLFRYDAATDTFSQYLKDAYGNTLEGENIYTLCEYGDALAIGIHEGKLKKWDFKANRLSDFDTPEIHYKIIRSVKCYDRRNLLVATQSGLFIVNETEQTVVHCYEDDLNPYGLSDNNVFSVYKDRDGGIWVGTMFGGVDYLPKRNYSFRKYFPMSTPNSLGSKRVRELCEDRNGNIWIGTEDKGVSVFNPRAHTFRHLSGKSEIHTNLAVMGDNDCVYVGLFKQGMEAYSIDDYSSRFYSGAELNLIDESSVGALFKDSQGGYWLGNSWGVYYAPDRNFRFRRLDQFGYAYIYDIAEDHDGRIWIATMGSGVMSYHLKSGELRTFTAEVSDTTRLSSNSVSSITVDRRGDVWLSTDRGGICRYNSETDDFTTFSLKDGFPDDVCYKILEDYHHNLWFGTNKGLVCFNPDSRSVRVFTEGEGLLSNQFNYKSALESSNGTFYFGSINGLIAFNPHKMGNNKSVPPVYITRLQVHNKEIMVGGADSLLTKALPFTDRITLRYDQGNINIGFVALNYLSPSSNKFMYRMEGVDNDWIQATGQSVAYSQLPPGEYKFMVRASNNDNYWNAEGASVEIIVTPPWWRSIYAYVAYILIVALIIYSIIRWYRRRKEQQVQRAYNLLEMKKERELYSSKVEFFTSIAHEIKTPLSLIKGPLENILDMEITDQRMHKSLKVMEMNTERLLSLINQLLDFRKIEGNRLSLNYTLQDVVKLLRETVIRFEPSIVQSGKSVTVTCNVDTLEVPIDKEEVTKVLSNLLNNALKYAAREIIVQLRCDENDFTITVSTDGEIIPPERRKSIFEPFYQLDEASSGVGLGLSLARSIAELHKGYLDLSVSPDGKYNCFTLMLPRLQENVIVWNTVENGTPVAGNEILNAEHNLSDMSGCSVLVVDDNVELLSFLVDRLGDKFVVFTAKDGEEALEVLTRETIHIVVSDVMMPRMDGFELCRRIKNAPEYNHIPVILLSAKSDMQSKLYGMEQGADAYMEKPFSFAYLVARVNNLLANRQKERESVLRRPLIHKLGGHTKAEEELMQRIVSEIQQNIADENFNVERLASILCMSRSALHRKIKELFDLPPVEYIRLVRLQQAARLLQEGKYSVAEVGTMVGIGSPSYFSRLFQKQFGVTPKVFVMQQRDKKR